jgi:hypothetical protein
MAVIRRAQMIGGAIDSRLDQHMMPVRSRAW